MISNLYINQVIYLYLVHIEEYIVRISIVPRALFFACDDNSSLSSFLVLFASHVQPKQVLQKSTNVQRYSEQYMIRFMCINKANRQLLENSFIK